MKHAGISVALVLFASVAVAQSRAELDPPPDPRARRFQVSLAGGVAGFTGGLSSVTDIGPIFGVSADARVWRALHLELDYRGIVFPITDTRLIQQSMWGHGLMLMPKFSIRYSARVYPFIAAGIGGWYLYPTDNAEGLFKSDFALDIPATIGAQILTDFFEAGLRGTWHALLTEELTDPHEVGRKSGGILSLELTLGVRI